MAFTPRRRAAPIGFNLTPMIDVTFLLLIFFVCANTWSHTQSAEELDLPAPIRSAQADAAGERPRLTINVRRDGTLLVSGKSITPERLPALVSHAQSQHGERLEILIRAHKEVPYARTQGVFQACAQAGVKQVRFAVLREKT